jgi:hypothetical protein
VLYLFSSNAQPQYAQDILNALAAPIGYRMTFRYDSKYVDAAAHAVWNKEHLANEPLVVHFVLQQSHEYFTPVLFPVCTGTVLDAFREGDIHLVEIAVGDVLSLAAPTPDVQNPQREMHPERTAAYRQALEGHALAVPYNKYAIKSDYNVLTDANASVVQAPNPQAVPEVFRLTTSYLSRTETFASARFGYVLRLNHGQDPVAIDAISHCYKLTAGEEYELEFLQAQPGLMTTSTVMNVVLDGTALQPIGPTQLSIGSRYDVQSVRMVAMAMTNGVKYTTIGLRPGDGVQGPMLDIPVEIHPSRGKNIKLGLGTMLPLVLIGLSSVLTDISTVWKVLIVAAGAGAAAYLSVFGWSTHAP